MTISAAFTTPLASNCWVKYFLLASVRVFKTPLVLIYSSHKPLSKFLVSSIDGFPSVIVLKNLSQPSILPNLSCKLDIASMDKLLNPFSSVSLYAFSNEPNAPANLSRAPIKSSVEFLAIPKVSPNNSCIEPAKAGNLADKSSNSSFDNSYNTCLSDLAPFIYEDQSAVGVIFIRFISSLVSKLPSFKAFLNVSNFWVKLSTSFHSSSPRSNPSNTFLDSSATPDIAFSAPWA